MDMQLISPAEVCKRFGIGIATLARIRKRDESFPKPFKLSGSRIGFAEHELTAWLESRRAVT
ncbi:helix-turn-helix transcriptional regulator [Roseibium alexandrii]|uniref:Putative transcriptional regulator n=1 Tax=Roseibium alexandrii (strain DSM 17067 / NCIMB 14079 / DFL-11) TaxID=244592 RepID=A0A5E8UXE9_ROSAD|nr:AlpA family phage regulatory protein [Roseibium alexandrii]RMX61845.1 putative transcriptional regulator [Roseibium alexandrii DFL-11]